MGNLNQSFLETITLSFKEFLISSARSNKKLKVLHGQIKNDLENLLKDIKGVNLISLDENTTSEDQLNGRYYSKKVDISIRKEGKILGAIGVKFVMNNYKQNSNNYFENMLGETANLRSAGIPYFQIFILFDKMPYFEKDKRQNKKWLKNWEKISEKTHLKKYIKLSEDDVREYYHTPILTLMTILSLPKEITDESNIKDKETFNKQLLEMLKNNTLKLAYSSKFSSDIFKDNVILNDYEKFLKKIKCYFLYKWS
jgi:hypothetical protein